MFRHPIRQPILGTEETIRCITPQLLTLCHRAFYNPANMILCVTGDVDPQEVCRIARQVLGDETRPMGQKDPFPAEEMQVLSPLVKTEMDIAMPMFNLGFKCEALDKGFDAICREVTGDLAAEVLFGEASNLYLQLYGEGLIDSSFGGGFETIDGCALLNCGGDSDHPEAVRDSILAEAQRIVREGVEETMFLRLKRSAMGRRIRDLDSFDSTCFRLCAYEMTDFDYFRFPEIYHSITPAQVQEFLARAVVAERSSLSIIDTLKEENL
jgi:predicted Zn-dependent peptidase